MQLQRAMAAEAEASREARAKVIAAEGEMRASRALKEASDVISMSPAALQVIHLRTPPPPSPAAPALQPPHTKNHAQTPTPNYQLSSFHFTRLMR